MTVGDKVYLRERPTQALIIRIIHEHAQKVEVSLFSNSAVTKIVRFDEIEGYGDRIIYNRTLGKYFKSGAVNADYIGEKPRVVIRTVPHTQKQIEILKELGLEHLIKA